MALMSYLLRDRHGTYYFRRAIPPALRPFMPEPWQGKREWKRSLATKDPATAKRLGIQRARDCSVDLQLAELRQSRAVREELTVDEIEALATQFYRHQLEQDADFRAFDHVENQEVYDENRQQLIEWGVPVPPLPIGVVRTNGMDQRQLAKKRETTEGVLAWAEEHQASGSTELVEEAVAALLESYGIDLAPDSRSYRLLALRCQEQQAAASQAIRARLDGKVIKVPKADTPKGDGTIGAALTELASAHTGPKLSEAVAHWKAGSPARGSRKPSANTVREADYAVRRFTEFHGDLRLGDLTREKVRQFRDALAQVPTRLPTAMQRLGLRELIALDHEGRPKVHSGTVNKLLTMLSAIVTFAIKEGLADALPNFANPFSHMKVAVDETAEEARDIFEAEHLDAIFSTPVYTQGARPAGGGGEAAYWLPLIALLTGARQGELAQLRIEDVKQDRETGVWFMDIGTKGGRTVKTATSRRKVPLHPELERLGLLRYRQSLMDGGDKPDAPLWPDIKSDSSGRRAGPWSKWFNRYLREVAGITDETRVFHSFRHTFKRLARDVMSEEISDAITGHKGRGGVGRDYGRGVGLRKLAEAIGKIEAPSSLAALCEPAVIVQA